MTMSHSNSAASGPTPSTLTHLNSPIPYLFGGLALMLALIATALIILAWSYRKHEDEEDENKPAKKVVDSVEDDFEPKVVVIMPGNLNPTHLAKPKPVASLTPDIDHKSDDHVPRGDEQV